VSYHPTDELIENVAALINQVDEIVIVDNGSGDKTKQLLNHLEKQYSKLNVVFLPENLGIAAALNIGVKKAKAAGYKWVITFDQDSQVTPFMIETMLRAYEDYPNKDIVASLSPRYKNKETGNISSSRFEKLTDGCLPYSEIFEVMTSGNLIKAKIFDSLGYFNEELFIDSVDTEYCFRCIRNNYKILEVKNATIQHSAGTPIQHKFLWKKPFSTNHSPLRRYYIARNSVYIYKNFFLYQFSWVIKHIHFSIKSLIVVILFEKNRKEKIIANFLGLLDGFSGKMGKNTRKNMY
jgi:rhamnosyltransferase